MDHHGMNGSSAGRIPEASHQSSMAEHVAHSSMTEHVTHSTSLPEHVTHNTMADHVTHNTMGDHVTHNTMPDHVTHNTIGDHVTHNSMSDHVNHNTMAEHVTHNTMADHVTHNTMADHVTHNTMGDHVTTHNTMSEHVQQNRIADHASHSAMEHAAHSMLDLSEANNPLEHLASAAEQNIVDHSLEPSGSSSSHRPTQANDSLGALGDSNGGNSFRPICSNGESDLMGGPVANDTTNNDIINRPLSALAGVALAERNNTPHRNQPSIDSGHDQQGRLNNGATNIGLERMDSSLSSDGRQSLGLDRLTSLSSRSSLELNRINNSISSDERSSIGLDRLNSAMSSNGRSHLGLDRIDNSSMPTDGRSSQTLERLSNQMSSDGGSSLGIDGRSGLGLERLSNAISSGGRSGLGLDGSSNLGLDGRPNIGIDERSGMGLDGRSNLGIDERSSMGLDGRSNLGLDERSGMGLDGRSNIGIDDRSGIGLDGRSNLGIDERSGIGLNGRSNLGLDERAGMGLDGRSNMGLDGRTTNHGLDGRSTGIGLDGRSNLDSNGRSALGLDGRSSQVLDRLNNSQMHGHSNGLTDMRNNSHGGRDTPHSLNFNQDQTSQNILNSLSSGPQRGRPPSMGSATGHGLGSNMDRLDRQAFSPHLHGLSSHSARQHLNHGLMGDLSGGNVNTHNSRGNIPYGLENGGHHSSSQPNSILSSDSNSRKDSDDLPRSLYSTSTSITHSNVLETDRSLHRHLISSSTTTSLIEETIAAVASNFGKSPSIGGPTPASLAHTPHSMMGPLGMLGLQRTGSSTGEDSLMDLVGRHQGHSIPMLSERASQSLSGLMDDQSGLHGPPSNSGSSSGGTGGPGSHLEKTHPCLTCLKMFRSKQQLAQHSLVHTGIRKHVCSYCDRAFKQLSHLQQHVRIHTGEFRAVKS